MPHIPTFTLQLTDGEKGALRWLAKEWNMIIGRGPMADEGSIREIVLSVASGNALFVPLVDDTEANLGNRIREIADENPDVADLLERMATALDRASYLFYDFSE
jgi:hypothetical protein